MSSCAVKAGSGAREMEPREMESLPGPIVNQHAPHPAIPDLPACGTTGRNIRPTRGCTWGGVEKLNFIML